MFQIAFKTKWPEKNPAQQLNSYQNAHSDTNCNSKMEKYCESVEEINSQCSKTGNN